LQHAAQGVDNSGVFQPSQHDVRRFFCEVWRKHGAGLPLDAMESQAAPWVADHPEYAGDLADLDAALAAVYTVEDGRTNPFLHLSMHLSIAEQVSIDQPSGIRQAVQLLANRLGLAARGAPPGDGMPGRDDLGLAAQRSAPRRPRVHRGRTTPRYRAAVNRLPRCGRRRRTGAISATVVWAVQAGG
jgi:hypothetical protein